MLGAVAGHAPTVPLNASSKRWPKSSMHRPQLHNTPGWVEQPAVVESPLLLAAATKQQQTTITQGQQGRHVPFGRRWGPRCQLKAPPLPDVLAKGGGGGQAEVWGGRH